MDHATAMARLIAGVMSTYSDDKNFLPQALEMATAACVEGMKKLGAAQGDLPLTASDRLLFSLDQRLGSIGALVERAILARPMS